MAGLLLTACGTPSTAVARRYTYASEPSVSAKMICLPRAVVDINHVLGVHTLVQPAPSWVRHRYSCPYRYATGTMVLSVKELPTLASAVGYLSTLRRAMGDAGAIGNAGAGGFSASDGSAVTRKDNKVLVVDVAGLPAMFGRPATTRAEVALTVTDLILACWRGD